MEVLLKMSENQNIGKIFKIEGYRIFVICDKRKLPDTPYIITEPNPVYMRDDAGNILLGYMTHLECPDSDLPKVKYTHEDSEGKIITEIINPATSFLLQTPLSQFILEGILINEDGIPDLMFEVNLLTDKQILDVWDNYGFTHLYHLAEMVKQEEFKKFISNFAKSFLSTLKIDKYRIPFLKTLINIGIRKYMMEHEEYLDFIRQFISDSAIGVAVNKSSTLVNIILRDTHIQYGDLICFKKEDQISMGTVKEVNQLATIELLFMKSGDRTTNLVNPIEIGDEAGFYGLDEIMEDLYSKFDDSYIKIPIGKIPNCNIPYKIFLRSRNLIHFAFIAISGSGKGNDIRELMFEYYKIRCQTPDKNNYIPPKLGTIIFDDVGEYAKSLNETDWGLDIGFFAIHTATGQAPSVTFIDPSLRVKDKLKEKQKNIENTGVYQYLQTKPAKIPIEYLPLMEIKNLFSQEALGYSLIVTYLRNYYVDNPEYKMRIFIEPRLSLEFLNYFFSINVSDVFNQNNRDSHNFHSSSYHAACNRLEALIYSNSFLFGIKIDDSNPENRFRYYDSITTKINRENRDKKLVEVSSISPEFNLIEMCNQAADQGKLVIIDESNLTPNTKLLIQRICLNDVVSKRERRGFNKDIVPCLFIIEEATALLRGKENKQFQLFAEIQVKARKFGIGIGLILQDIKSLDTSLLTQLGWMIAMGLPVDSMRSLLFNTVPADLGPFDKLIKRADVGLGVGFQRILGKNLPIPLQVYHYEHEVASLLAQIKDFEVIKKQGSLKTESQDDLSINLSNLEIQPEVILKLRQKIIKIREEIQ